MGDLQAVFSEAVKLNRSISQFLKFSTYTDYDDLSGLIMDPDNGDNSFSAMNCGSSPTSWRTRKSALPI